MSFHKIYIFLTAALIGSYLFAGCASSSNTSRYKNKSEKKTPTDPSVRFTSEERKNNFTKGETSAD
ncbi:MAG: hypothetical protein ACM34O_06820, partial [Ignavibacteria bacterium]